MISGLLIMWWLIDDLLMIDKCMTESWLINDWLMIDWLFEAFLEFFFTYLLVYSLCLTITNWEIKLNRQRRRKILLFW